MTSHMTTYKYLLTVLLYDYCPTIKRMLSLAYTHFKDYSYYILDRSTRSKIIELCNKDTKAGPDWDGLIIDFSLALSRPNVPLSGAALLFKSQRQTTIPFSVGTHGSIRHR